MMPISTRRTGARSGIMRSAREPPRDRYDRAMQFTAAVTHEGALFAARCLEVEVASQGRTVEEALENLKEALELYFEDEALPEDLEPPIIATVRLSA